MSLNICLGGKLFLGPQYANGTVTFYDVGTLDLQTTYSDKAGTVPNLTTITLDAYGAATVFLTKDAKIVAKTADATEIYTQDGGLIPASTTETGFNLISNGSAEIDSDGDGIPDDWTVSAEAGSTNVRVSSDQIHGAYCFKSTDGGSGGGTWLGDPYIPVSGNQPIGYWFELNASHVDVRIVVDVLWYDSSKNQLSGGSAKTNLYDDSAANPTAWARFTGQITPPAGAVYGRFQVALCHSSAASAGKWAEIDNIQLFPTTAVQILTTAGDILYADSAYHLARKGIGNAGQSLVVNQAGTAPVYRNSVDHGDGLTLSAGAVDTVNDIAIAAGASVDYTSAYILELTSALTKQSDAVWSVGDNAGALDGTEAVAGTMDASSLMYIYSIRKTADGVCDVIFSLNAPATGPSMPAGYALYSWIGYFYTDAGALIDFTTLTKINPSGSVVQTVYKEDSTISNTTTLIPFDDTIPQNTEGAAIISVDIVPKDAKNILVIEWQTVLAHRSSGTGTFSIPLFQDSGADAIKTPLHLGVASLRQVPINGCHVMTAGTAVKTTFSVRGGSDTAGTVDILGYNGGRKYGGTLVSWIKITEYKG